MFIDRDEFAKHPLFNLVFQQIILWKVLSKYSKKHDVVLSEIFKESKELFDSDRMSKYSESQIEKASIFKFIKKIMLELEVVDRGLDHRQVGLDRGGAGGGAEEGQGPPGGDRRGGEEKGEEEACVFQGAPGSAGKAGRVKPSLGARGARRRRSGGRRC